MYQSKERKRYFFQMNYHPHFSGILEFVYAAVGLFHVVEIFINFLKGQTEIIWTCSKVLQTGFTHKRAKAVTKSAPFIAMYIHKIKRNLII